jgi:hypothetical protein
MVYRGYTTYFQGYSVYIFANQSNLVLDDSSLLLRVEMRARNVSAMINHQKRQRGTKEIPGRTRSFNPTTFAHDAYLGLFHYLLFCCFEGKNYAHGVYIEMFYWLLLLLLLLLLMLLLFYR